MKSPIETLVIITNRKKTEHIERILDHYKVGNHLVIMGKGTSNSALGDIFSFGIIDRDVICALVTDETDSRLFDKLRYEFVKGRHDDGVAFTMPVDAISSDLFSRLKEIKNVR